MSKRRKDKINFLQFGYWWSVVGGRLSAKHCCIEISADHYLPTTNHQIFRMCVALLLAFSLCGGGCTILKSSKPNLPKIYNAGGLPRPSGKRPVIVIPGTLGSRLVNQKTNEVAWPQFIISENATLALPITSADFSENRDDLVATEIIDRAKFFRLSPEIGFYDSLLTSLEQAGGYKRGNWDEPGSDGDHDTFYVFAYDWRRDIVENANELSRKINKLKQKLNQQNLLFDVIAHSMGGLIARYAAMYGDQNLSENPAAPNWIGAQHFARLILFGTPNSGSMDAFSTVINGYSTLGTNFPQLKLIDALDRDAIFTSPAIYQMMPQPGAAKFFDEKLEPLKLDLFDLETWRKYGWSIAFDAGFKERELKRFQKIRHKLMKKKDAATESKLGEMEEQMQKMIAAREPFLSSALRRAKAFHQAINTTSTMPLSLQIHLFGGDCERTLEGAVVTPNQTWFRINRSLGKSDFRTRAEALIYAPGDGRVTRRSLFGLRFDENSSAWMSPLNQPERAVFQCELHGDLPLNATMQNNLLTLLLGGKY